MKEFSEYKASREPRPAEYLTESENLRVEEGLRLFEEECGGDLNNVDEGFLGKLIGGVGGFLAGPTIGRIVARALGVERGVLYDMFTSRLVSTALGVAIGKYVSGPKDQQS